jgi:hypothetical protein
MTILLLFLALFSCNTVDTDLSLDELTDMEEYSGGMVVDCEKFQGEKTEWIRVNNSEKRNPGTLDLSKAGFYRIEVFTGCSSGGPEVIRVVILDPDRGEAEWGLPPWTPAGVVTETIGDQDLLTIYPRNIPPGSGFPLIVVVGDHVTGSTANLNAAMGSTDFLVKRGVGSAWIPPGEQSSNLLKIDHRTFTVQTGTITSPPLSLGGVMNEDTRISAGSFVHISEDLTIPSGHSLTIETGVFIAVDPEVNIYNEGALIIEGSPESPVTITCADDEAFWGGVIGTGVGNLVEASHVIICRSGHHTGGANDYGHAHRQALFYCENGSLSLDHCYMIDHAGQIFYPVSASLEMEYCLVQRAKTGGQINDSRLVIDHSVFTDFPDDLTDYRDDDNDGLYLMESDATISHSVFMCAKDDGLDSGGSGGGKVHVSHTRFESVFHEGAALSSGGSVSKEHHFSNCIFTDCGQGLELGYSSPNHQVHVDSCMFIGNGIGIRYGDNYSTSHQGYLSVSNSESVENEIQDIWNMVRETWAADTFRMAFDNVWVTTGDPMYPQLKTHD